MIGQVLGNCRIDSVIGSGGMGVVYKGLHQSLGVPVAVKLIKEEFARDEELLARFTREAQAAARLRHPNLVRVYDVGAQGPHNYIVMEYLEGTTLEAVIQKHTVLEGKTFFRTFFSLAQALFEVHKAGIVHRDVKPENVIVVDGNKPVLTDFGIAGGVAGNQTLTQPGHLLGTPAYMSPEQARGDGNLDPRTDIFALGMMMYEAASGRLPQYSANVLEQIRRRATEPIPPIKTVNGGVPDPLAAVIDAAVSFDPAGRWSDGGKLSAAIADAYKQVFSADQSISSSGSAPTPVIKPLLSLPQEDIPPVAWKADVLYTDVFSLIVAMENSRTGFGVLQIHYGHLTDTLLFSKGNLRLAHRRAKNRDVFVDLEEVLEQYETAESGAVDALISSEAYYRALKCVLTTRPTIGKMRSSFVDLRKLLAHLASRKAAGVLRLEYGGKLGMVGFSSGAPGRLWLSTLLSDEAPPDLERLIAAVSRSADVELDFHDLDRETMQTSDAAPLDTPLERGTLETLVSFTNEIMERSGRALEKAFGLGTRPVLEKHLRLSARDFPAVLESLELNDAFSIAPKELVGRAEQLPRTGRRQHVVHAVRSLIQTRITAVKEALPTERKRKKTMKEIEDTWAKNKKDLEADGVGQELADLFDAER